GRGVRPRLELFEQRGPGLQLAHADVDRPGVPPRARHPRHGDGHGGGGGLDGCGLRHGDDQLTRGRWLRVVLTLGLVALLLLACGSAPAIVSAGAPAGTAVPSAQPSFPIRAAFYYPWFP